MAGLNFMVRPPSGEEPDIEGLAPDETVEQLARIKCLEVAGNFNESTLVIAADTMVCLDGYLMGKPKSRDEAIAMLGALSGKRHTVFTGIALALGGDIRSESQKTHVFFRKLEDREIQAYVDTGEPMDKAGAYGIQGRGALFISKIDGDYYNVVGLPLCRLSEMLSEMGVNLL